VTRATASEASAAGPAPRHGVELVRVAGVQIAIDYSWLAVFLLVLWSLSAGYFPAAAPGHETAAYWGVGLLATALFFASVVVHELAHALVANRTGHDVRRITLFVFGGMAHLGRESQSPKAELGIAAVGPATSLALGAAFWLGARWAAAADVPVLGVAMLRYLSFVNLALAVFNLLPGLPLDGGRLLRAVLWLKSGDLRRATATAARWGGGIGLGLMALGVLQIFGGTLVGGLWLVFIGMFLRSAAGESFQAMLFEQALAGSRVGDLMIPDPVVVPASLTVEEALEQRFLRHGFGGFPVADDGRVEGLVSLRQVRACPPEQRARRRVRDIMRPAEPAVEIAASASVGDALRRMGEADSGRLLVTDGGRIVGLVTRTGIHRFLETRAALARERAA
jgi:Zn-dependent protease/CBS domain-containing protein